jgi:hypothetical protein
MIDEEIRDAGEAGTEHATIATYCGFTMVG